MIYNWEIVIILNNRVLQEYRTNRRTLIKLHASPGCCQISQRLIQPFKQLQQADGQTSRIWNVSCFLKLTSTRTLIVSLNSWSPFHLDNEARVSSKMYTKETHTHMNIRMKFFFLIFNYQHQRYWCNFVSRLNTFFQIKMNIMQLESYTYIISENTLVASTLYFIVITIPNDLFIMITSF